MNKSRFAFFDSNSMELQLSEVEIPALLEGEILVNVSYTTLCKSDILTYTGKRQEKNPTILGHEICGTIVAFGKNAPTLDCRNTKLEIGDLIGMEVKLQVMLFIMPICHRI